MREFPTPHFHPSKDEHTCIQTMGDNFNFQDHNEGEEVEEAEKALSLPELPLDDPPIPGETPPNYFSDHRSRRCSPQPQDIFEFFRDGFCSDHVMCSADDVIICGKLVPFKGPHGPPSLGPTGYPLAEASPEEERTVPSKASSLGLRSRSESSSNSHSNKAKLRRNSRSMDYQKLRRFSSSISYSPETLVNTSSSIKTSRKWADVLARKPTRPRWSMFMFGTVKFPAEMELEDMKTRQLRRNPTSLFVPTERTASASSEKLSMSRSKGSWRFIKALSCKDHTNVAVVNNTASLAPFPHGESFA